MRNLGDKAKGMAQGLRDRLGAAWGRQDQAADRGAAERIAEATAQRGERDRDGPEPGSAAERIAGRLDKIGKHDPLERERRRRSEEHTSELQSLMRISYAVFCLKKKKQTQNKETVTPYSHIHSIQHTYS